MKNKKLILFAILAAIVVAVFVVYAQNRDGSVQSTQIIKQKKDAPIQSEKQAKQNSVRSENVPTSTLVSVGAVTANQANGLVTAEADLSGTGNSLGYCVFTFENEFSKPVIKQIPPKTTVNGLICNSGNISEVEFSVIGSWKLTIRYFNNGTQASNSTIIEIK